MKIGKIKRYSSWRENVGKIERRNIDEKSRKNSRKIIHDK
jgi:hypothetical protein